MFFIDLEGAEGDDAVTAAIAGLREKAESVRVLGSYPVQAPGDAAATD
jgi:prephenate dehydratase